MNSGYSAHVMRPTYWPLIEALSAPQTSGRYYAVACFDWSGAGYSEGVRSLVNPEGMVDDLRQFVELVLAEKVRPGLPFYGVGQSMGAAVHLLHSAHAWERSEQGALGSNCKFGGCVGVSPLTRVDKPPTPALAFLGIMASLFPERSLPGFLGSSLPDDATWKSEELIAWHVTHDVRGAISSELVLVVAYLAQLN